MAEGTVHIVGAGLAGLAAAIGLVGTGRKIVVHELARHAGGRCRSYFEPTLGLTIDNGNHLLLSANHAALAYLGTIGAEEKLVGPEDAEFAFADLASGERWLLRPNKGRVPVVDFFRGAARARHTTGRLSGADGAAAAPPRPQARRAHRLQGNAVRAAFAAGASGRAQYRSGGSLGSACQRNPRETLARGGSACRPLVAEDGLGAAFIDPALAYLEREGAKLRFDHQLRRFELAGDKVAALDFGEDIVTLAANDRVILAVPAKVASAVSARAIDAERIPRHRQRAFQNRIRRKTFPKSSASSTARRNGCSPFPSASRSPSAPPTD